MTLADRLQRIADEWDVPEYVGVVGAHPILRFGERYICLAPPKTTWDVPKPDYKGDTVTDLEYASAMLQLQADQKGNELSMDFYRLTTPGAKK